MIPVSGISKVSENSMCPRARPGFAIQSLTSLTETRYRAQCGTTDFTDFTYSTTPTASTVSRSIRARAVRYQPPHRHHEEDNEYSGPSEPL